MSMRNSFVYGLGFYCDCDGNKLIDFVKAHKETFCMTDYEKELYIDILDCIEETGYLFELLEDYSCDTTGFNGIGAVISNIMSRETGVRFEYYPGEDACYTPNAICFTRSFPWLFNEIEKNLTRDKLEDICGKYMNELGITDEFSFLELEYLVN